MYISTINKYISIYYTQTYIHIKNKPNIQFKKTRFIVFKISADRNIEPDTVAPRLKTWKDLQDILLPTQPRFILYDYEFLTRDKRHSDTMYLIFWVPENVSQKDRIQYTQALTNFKDQLPGVELKEIYNDDDLKAQISSEVIVQ